MTKTRSIVSAVTLFLATTAASLASAAPGMTVGFIYVGPKTDYGYNQAHAQGAAVIAKLPGVKIREEEMVPETVAVQKTMESMINLDGAKLIFPTSFGYFDPHILKEAGKNKDVTFLHCGGMWTEGKPVSWPVSRRRATSWASSPPSRFPRSSATSTRTSWAPSR
jgi:basic membrane protein A and related proteins